MRVIKRPPLLILTSFVCYLRQLYFAVYTVSNFSYSLKSSSVTFVHLFNTEKNRSSIEKLRLLLYISVYGNCERGSPVVTPSQNSLLFKKNYCEFL